MDSRAVIRVEGIERSALGKAKAAAIPANREAANIEAAESAARTANREKAEVVIP